MILLIQNCIWDPRYYSFIVRPTRRSSHHHEKRWLPTSRHRYPYSLAASHVDMGVRRHRSDRYNSQHAHHSSNSKFQGDMLKLHNHYRARHCAPPLVLSQQLNQIAQSYAEHLAATSTFEHSGNQLGSEQLGENLFMQWISFGRPTASGREAMQSWYNEIGMYDFDKPKYSKETGHFTQMVWRSSRKLGVGIAYSPKGNEVYIVANYYPAGNTINPGYFENNVLPPNC
ncbi:unnamed protein product [Rotaria sordida]|uniref:SCP domain-containing protein n=2 Tax=Rotaria sordida TaxID=392033 RepID=A0A815QQ27_9BILA|nr:unnamed protein product [Rotaria sordida]